ncbi:porin family protein [Tardiphaga alba]|uniref:Porin family protein n=1 Tax=Tardiphaga alba TaxID=340268 RepID=A0ABX8A307_9BRAD|nr:outer membrane protein [Tardiphaga alba]QUS37951.1 porin family protein [Tardiphaga alba]
MKRLLLASAALIGTAVSAQAADMAVKAPYYKAPVVAVYNWTGFYIGVNAGVGVGRDRITHSFTNDSLYRTPQGGFGGGQIGWNWQTDSFLGPLVYGLEADIQGSGMTDGRTSVVGANTLPTAYSQKLDWFGTVRGRLGLATGPVLSYVTAGFAYGNVNSTITETGVGAVSSSRTATGWTVGSGVEAALGGNWTGKIEYLYLNLGSRSIAFDAPFAGQLANSELRENLFRVGLNYRIGGNSTYTPVVAANWTGWYLGGNVGSGTGRSPSSLTGTNPVVINEAFNLAPDGINGGAQIGYNWQASNWVYGLEADIQASSQRDNKTVVGFGNIAYDARLPWFGTVRGRLGYSVGSTLFYATGGFAYGGVHNKLFNNGVQIADFSSTKTGWTAGAGIETPFKLLGLFGPNWTSKTEYLYVDLGRTNDLIPNGDIVSSTKTTEHIFRTGLNYHFNTPVVAKY